MARARLICTQTASPALPELRERSVYSMIEVGRSVLRRYCSNVRAPTGSLKGIDVPLFAAQTESGIGTFLLTGLDLIGPYLFMVGLYLYLMVLLEQLLYVAINQSEMDTKVRPWPWTGLIVGLVFPLITPGIHLVPPFSLVDRIFGMDLRGIWINGLLGLVTGSAVGLGIAQGWDIGLRRALLASLGLVGLFLGWRASVSVGLTTVVLGLLSQISATIGRKSLSVSATWSVWFATVLELIVWRSYPEIRWWPGPDASPVVMIAACILMFGGSSLIPRVGRRRAQPGSPPPTRSLS